MTENDDIVTMHDVLDAQWLYDNTRDGACLATWRMTLLLTTRLMQSRTFGASKGR